mmetsp:Transcript_18860/g.50193  ORF Transcript_18860/g.50193 Transcript_18860/m.50193 type:complete len:468 (+) Transcript_18860:60-1463(+)
MLVRFSCTSFAPVTSRLAVVGGCPELGDWSPDHAKVMACRLGHGRLQSEPDFHWVDVELPSSPQGIEYKFIELHCNGVHWEETGGNRHLHLDGEKAGELHLLPVEKFGTAASESDHTASFYSGVKQRGEISVRRVTSQIFIGSCPRSTQHIDYLKSLGITCIANFQSVEDCKRNCVAGIGMEGNAEAVRGEYDRRGMLYVWTPTADMCSDGRTRMLPQTSHTFACLLREGHVIYSHCNAGVGRSVSAVCGYLTYVLGLTDRQMQHVVASSRPAAFFDFDALQRARPRFSEAFGKDTMARACDDAKFREKLDAVPLASSQITSGTALVRFSIACAAQGRADSRVVVVGSCPELGSWSIEDALTMNKFELDCHSADVALPVGAWHQIEYKFVVLDGECVRWEEFSRGGNRRLEDVSASDGKSIMLPVARFGELCSDEKQRKEAMAVIRPCTKAEEEVGRLKVPDTALGA